MKMEKFNFYDSFMIRYAESSEEMKKSSRDHWIKCHIENMNKKREDLEIFTEQILARITIVDAGKYADYFKAKEM